jgi:hypothetical protein
LSFRQRSTFCFNEESQCHSDREFLLLRRGIFVFSKGIDSSVAKSSFRMTVASCHSDREVFLLRRGIFRTSTVKILQSPIGFFRMTAASYHSDREAFLFRRGIFLSFRQRSFLASTRNLNVIPTKKFFCFDEESLCHSDREFLLLRRGIFVFSKGIDSSVAKSSFRMTAASCHSDREAFWLRRGI